MGLEELCERPAVLRKDGLSACGLNAGAFFATVGSALGDCTFCIVSAARLVTNPIFGAPSNDP